MAYNHGTYHLHIPQPSPLNGMFGEEYTYDPTYDAMYLNDTSSSPVHMIWNTAGDLAALSAEREYSMTTMYERLDSA